MLGDVVWYVEKFLAFYMSRFLHYPVGWQRDALGATNIVLILFPIQYEGCPCSSLQRSPQGQISEYLLSWLNTSQQSKDLKLILSQAQLPSCSTGTTYS